jgi:hypothetical protein
LSENETAAKKSEPVVLRDINRAGRRAMKSRFGEPDIVMSDLAHGTVSSGQPSGKPIGALAKNVRYYPIGVPLRTDYQPLRTVIQLKMRGKRFRWADVLVLCCLHFGHKDQNLTALKSAMAMALALNMPVIILGDVTDQTQFRQAYLGASSVVRRQYLEAGSYIKRIAHLIIYVTPGNHDVRVLEATQDAWPINKSFFRKIGCKGYIVEEPGRGVIAAIKVGKHKYPFYAFHSRSGGMSNEFIALQRALQNFIVPLILGGHVHRLGDQEKCFFSPTEHKGKFYNQSYKSRLVLTGCSVNNPAYGEEKAYGFTNVGAVIVRFHGDTENIDIFDPRDLHPEFYKKPPSFEPDPDFDF